MAFYALTPNHWEAFCRRRRREPSQLEGSPPSLIREPPDRNMVPVVTSAAACKHFSEVDLTDTHREVWLSEVGVEEEHLEKCVGPHVCSCLAF